MSVVKNARPIKTPINYLFLGTRMAIHIPGEQEEQQLSLIELFMPPGGDDGLHVHLHEDEAMYLISGKLDVAIGNLQFTLLPGESYFVPRQVPHRIRNTGEEEARGLLIKTPGLFASLVGEAGTLLKGTEIPKPAPLSPETLLKIRYSAEQFGSRFLLPPFEEGTIAYPGKPPIYKRAVYKRDPETYLFFGLPTIMHLAGIETGNELSLFESYLPANGDSGLHAHANEDEYLYLLSGELELTIGEHSCTLKSGASCLIPNNTPHRLRNKKKKQARVLQVNTPGTLDPFVRMAGLRIKGPGDVTPPYPSPDQVGPILLLSEEYDFHMLIPPGM